MYYRTFGTKLSHIAPAWALAQPRISASLWGRLLFLLDSSREWASLVAQRVKNPSVMRETWVQSLGWEDPLEKGTATHSSILAWRIPCSV